MSLRSGAAPAKRRLITIACLLAQFMAAVESTIVGTAMPTIVGDLGGFRSFSWVFAAYLLMQAVSTPIYGRLADVHGRKPVFLVGATLFLAASTACGFAWGMVPLILFRALQGLGAGAIQPIAWTIIGDIYPPSERGRMQGWLSSVFAGSALLGPALGAFIVVHLSWPLVFWVNVPVGAAAMTMLALLLDEPAAAGARRIDWPGAGLLMVGVGALLAALVQSQSFSGAALVALAAAGGAALIALAILESRTSEPILPYRLWRHPLIAIGNFGSLTIGIAMMCNGAYLPAYVQGAIGDGPMVAGMVLGSSSVVWTVGTFWGARLMTRTSYRVAGVTGSLIILAGTAISLALEPSRGALWATFGAATLGLGLGFCNTTFIVAVQTAVDWGERGAMTAANLFMRTIGQSLGAALFGFVLSAGIARRVPGAGDAVNLLLQPGTRQSLPPLFEAQLRDAFAGAMHEAYYVMGLFAVAVLVFSLCIPARLSPVRLPPRSAPRLEPSAADD
jgi:EmrB/QacA subfamily drug resistance transporter